MDSIISLGQKNTLAEYMSDADNRPPMLDKDLKFQADCDMKATNIILQGLPADIYSLVNHHRVAKDLWERVQLLNAGLPPDWSKFVTDVSFLNYLHTNNFDQFHANPEQHELYANEVCFAIPVFSPRDDPIVCLNKAMDFLTTVASSSGNNSEEQWQNYSCTTYKGNATSSKGNTTNGQARVVKCYNCQDEGHMARQCTQLKRPRNTVWYKEKAMLAEAREAGQILDEEQLAFLADPVILAGQAQTIIPHNDFQQSPVMDFTDNEISSDRKTIHNLKYFARNTTATRQDTNLQAQQDSMILSMIEQMSEQMINHFDSVVKKRTTPNALEEGEWGFEHTKTVFNNEIIPFLKSLKDIFNVFDKDILNEITEVQIVFDQMEVAVQQSSVDKQFLEIAKKEIILENNRLLQKIMSQDVFKDQFDSIKQTRVRHKEQSNSLINKLNLKSVENEDLKAQIQDKVPQVSNLPLRSISRNLNGSPTISSHKANSLIFVTLHSAWPSVVQLTLVAERELPAKGTNAYPVESGNVAGLAHHSQTLVGANYMASIHVELRGTCWDLTSRLAVVVWLFVGLIITQSYTASFASMLTAQRLEPTITSVEMLRNMNATVGYCNGSLVNHYLNDVLLGFKSIKVNSYNSTHRYAEALNSGEIASIFLEVPVAKVFIAQYCKSFIRTGGTFKVGGFGFVSSLGSQFLTILIQLDL
ncbi:retrovirus-related pol polyprotein from transposon TNT 1-94 [Tanacetum coccineum]|uniref:Retrovirus-related pol polyprotein from transposon TNT 1-94 n=1 Tax=Tanacetum coccineum TaxID=301880 RepID=A0ABQ5FPS1_9ASTR